MRNIFIKILGGYTKNDVANIVKKHKNEIYETRIGVFRAGDSVYIKNRTGFDILRPYYLLEGYNGNTCWYVSTKYDDKERRVSMGVNIRDISFDKPEKCTCCGSVIK